MAASGQWSGAQLVGRAVPVGCVALEITQRCNLDCTLCYLSESSEAVKDLPLEELFRRIDDIARRYGAGTNVQITGGEPTLRPRAELLAIVRRAVERHLRPALFTNGIRASRALLAELCGAGLREIAFHVDTTQQRKGYASEAELNAVRDMCIERARGLPLAVYFNTTVHDGNFAELPALVRYFVSRSDVVRLASFQLQADTGRGVLGTRAAALTPQSASEQIMKGAGTALDFDAVHIGHARCNRYAAALIANGRAYDALDERGFIARFMAQTAALPIDRLSWRRSAAVLLAHGLRRPAFLLHALGWLARKAWRMRRDLLAAGGRVRKLTFFVHNFMDAGRLEQERIDACAFAVATSDGPVSMCQHNAARDAELLKPLPMRVGFWNPLTGTLGARPPSRLVVQHSAKTAKGRVRERIIGDHRNAERGG
ncbi:MAG TPA: radical SAM protein [Burkholderiales bacterium]